MSVLDVKKGWTGCASSGDDQVRNFTQVFTVTTDSASDGEPFVYPLTDGTQTIPAPGTYWGATAYRSRVPRAVRKGPMYWEISVEWATPRPGSLPPSNYDDPLAMPAEYSWGSQERQVTYTRDITGHPVVNTLGEAFDPYLVTILHDPVVVITRNQAAWSVDDIIAFVDTVNAGTFLGFAAGRGKMEDIQAQTVHASSDYWRVSFRAAFRVRIPDGVPAADAWATRVDNKGHYYKVGGVKYDFKSGIPEPLKADGTPPAEEHPEDAAVLTFYEYPSANWSALGLE